MHDTSEFGNIDIHFLNSWHTSVSVWIPLKLHLRLWSYIFFLPFFFSRVFGVMRLLFMTCSLNSSRKCWIFHSKQCIRALFTDPQIPFFNYFFIKNGSHGTIHIFKNYFATVFSVFSFQFQQNKFYPNRPSQSNTKWQSWLDS